MQGQWLLGFLVGLALSAAGFSTIAAFKPVASTKIPDKLDLRPTIPIGSGTKALKEV
jgi:hypothetical protein